MRTKELRLSSMGNSNRLSGQVILHVECTMLSIRRLYRVFKREHIFGADFDCLWSARMSSINTRQRSSTDMLSTAHDCLMTKSCLHM